MMSIANLGFGILKSIFKNPKYVFTIPLESRLGTSKFEISVAENPKIYIFASKFKFLNFLQTSTKILGIPI